MINVTLTLLLDDSQHALVTWVDEEGGKSAIIWGDKKLKEDGFLDGMDNWSINGDEFPRFTVKDETRIDILISGEKREYTQVNVYDVTKDGLVFNPSSSDMKIVFVPITLKEIV